MAPHTGGTVYSWELCGIADRVTRDCQCATCAEVREELTPAELDTLPFDAATEEDTATACPLCYSVEVADITRGVVRRTVVIRNQDIDDARSWANHYREMGYLTNRAVTILAMPAIPYAGDWPRTEVN